MQVLARFGPHVTRALRRGHITVLTGNLVARLGHYVTEWIAFLDVGGVHHIVEPSAVPRFGNAGVEQLDIVPRAEPAIGDCRMAAQIDANDLTDLLDIVPHAAKYFHDRGNRFVHTGPHHRDRFTIVEHLDRFLVHLFIAHDIGMEEIGMGEVDQVFEAQRGAAIEPYRSQHMFGQASVFGKIGQARYMFGRSIGRIAEPAPDEAIFFDNGIMAGSIGIVAL